MPCSLPRELMAMPVLMASGLPWGMKQILGVFIMKILRGFSQYVSPHHRQQWSYHFVMCLVVVVHLIKSCLTLCNPMQPFSSFLHSFPASGSFPLSQFFASRWQRDWSFSFSISPSNECSGLISFRIDWFDLLAVQGTLKSLLQHHSSKALILLTQPSSWSNSHIHIWQLEKP